MAQMPAPITQRAADEPPRSQMGAAAIRIAQPEVKMAIASEISVVATLYRSAMGNVNCHHADEMHRPDADAHGERRRRSARTSVARVGCGDAGGQRQGGVGHEHRRRPTDSATSQ